MQAQKGRCMDAGMAHAWAVDLVHEMHNYKKGQGELCLRYLQRIPAV